MCFLCSFKCVFSFLFWLLYVYVYVSMFHARINECTYGNLVSALCKKKYMCFCGEVNFELFLVRVRMLTAAELKFRRVGVNYV